MRASVLVLTLSTASFVSGLDQEHGGLSSGRVAELQKRSSMPSITSSEAGTGSSTSQTSTTSAASQSSDASLASSTSSSDSSASSSDSVLPSMSSEATSSDGMPVLSTTSTTSSSTSYTYSASVPTDEDKNPYISRSTLPNNTVFVALAGVMGLIAMGVCVTWMVIWINSRKQARTEKEVQYYNPFRYEESTHDSASHLLSGSSQSSFFEKSNSSVYSFSDSMNLNMQTTTPGRSYRELSSNKNKRSSMTISPVLELLRSSGSNLELPLYSLPHESSRLNLSEDSISRPPKPARPPSQVLDDMLSAIEYSTNYPN